MLRGEVRGNAVRTEGRVGEGTQLILFDDAEQADEAVRRLEGWDKLVGERDELKDQVKRLEVFETVCMKLLAGELDVDAARTVIVGAWSEALGLGDMKAREHYAAALRKLGEIS